MRALPLSPPSNEAGIATERRERMGISSMPAPRDSLVAYLLYSTAVSIAALAGLVRAALAFLDL
jgi:hypothetical protein